MQAGGWNTTGADRRASSTEHCIAPSSLWHVGRVPRWVLRHGPRKTLLAIVVLTVLATLAIAMPTTAWMWQGSVKDKIWLALAVIVPVLISWPIGMLLVDLVFALDAARRYAEAQAQTDSTTHLPNRRHFFERSSEMLEAGAATATVAMVLVDIDDFKSINDRHGHLVGDRVLFEVAQACRNSLHVDVLFARFGGEEFVAMMATEDLRQAHAMGERICRKVGALALKLHNGMVVRPTVSVGVATGSRACDSIDALLGRADKAMYAAKRDGKNRAVALCDGDSEFGYFERAV